MSSPFQVMILLILSLAVAGAMVGILALLGWSMHQDSAKRAEAKAWAARKRELREAIESRRVK